MSAALSTNTLLVKEQVGMFKASSNYDIFDAASGSQLMSCREPKLGPITKIFRFTDYKTMTPFNVEVRDSQGNLIVRVKRGVSFLLSKVEVFDSNEQRIGGFKQKLMSIGGKFEVLDAADRSVCMLKGKWTGWDFRFMQGETQLAHVTKKWSGIGKELFTSADNYVLEISPELGVDSNERKLILAAVMCIDMVLKE